VIRIVEAIQGYLKHLNESLADCTASVAETGFAVTQMTDAVRALTRKMVEFHDEQRELNARLNLYLQQQAKDQGSLERFKSEVREKLKVAGAER
jgi:hypothetical protein